MICGWNESICFPIICALTTVHTHAHMPPYLGAHTVVDAVVRQINFHKVASHLSNDEQTLCVASLGDGWIYVVHTASTIKTGFDFQQCKQTHCRTNRTHLENRKLQQFAVRKLPVAHTPPQTRTRMEMLQASWFPDKPLRQCALSNTHEIRTHCH